MSINGLTTNRNGHRGYLLCFPAQCAGIRGENARVACLPTEISDGLSKEAFDAQHSLLSIRQFSLHRHYPTPRISANTISFLQHLPLSADWTAMPKAKGGTSAAPKA